jgi:hypothetical protein
MIDPEIANEARVRAEVEQDRPDTNYDRQVRELLDDPVITRWRCRTHGCGELVDAPKSAVDSLTVFNAQLERRRQSPIQTDEVLFCGRCKGNLKVKSDEARRAKSERLAPIVKLLTQSAQPEREHALIRQLREWKHPDVDGLVQALVQRRGRSGGGSI